MANQTSYLWAKCPKYKRVRTMDLKKTLKKGVKRLLGEPLSEEELKKLEAKEDRKRREIEAKLKTEKVRQKLDKAKQRSHRKGFFDVGSGSGNPFAQDGITSSNVKRKKGKKKQKEIDPFDGSFY